jgi:hypothetical protein
MCDDVLNEIYDKQILEDVKFTEKDSIQFFHYEKGSIRKYDRLLKKHNLTQETRDDPNGYYHEGEALDNFTVAPIFGKDGKKICWGMYFTDNSCCKFKTKKDAMIMMRELATPEEPWYSDLPGYGTLQGVYLNDGEYGH